MKKNLLLLGLLAVGQAMAQVWTPREWPVLKHYDREHLYQVALPIGGIGTGTVSLGGRGELRDWEVMNLPAKGYSTVMKGNNAPFFAIYAKEEGKPAVAKALMGQLYDYEFQHYDGRPADHHGLPRFKNASFDAAYPFGQVTLTDTSIPVKVKVKGFNPFIPGDEEKSGIPIAALCYEVTNLSDKPLEVSVCGSVRNFIGKDGSRHTLHWKGTPVPQGAKQNQNEFRSRNGLKGIYMFSEKVDSKDPAWGTLALTTQASDGVTYRTSSVADGWTYKSMLHFWDDFSADGKLTEVSVLSDDDPMASLAVSKELSPGEKQSFVFFLTWNFPNRKAWAEEVVGNYYSTKYGDAWDIAEKVVPQVPGLEEETLLFVNTFLDSSYPEVVKEAALFNLSTLRSQTVFRLPDGHLMGWEGVMDKVGSCPGSCTHVWNYEVATPFLFGKLAQTMRDVEFNIATKENGLMSYRTPLPFSLAVKDSLAAADGQLGCIMKFYREWQLSGDDDFLSSNWEQVKKVLAYAWLPGGWDANQDGVMEGKQHNTMDVDYYGPNPQVGFWYLGALRATEEMALRMKDKDLAKKCRRLFHNGSQWMDQNLFNGEYYEHHITDPKTFELLDMDDPKTKIPDFQVGKGCLVDQLVGQYMAHICGLGYLGNKDHIKQTLKSVMKYNYVTDFSSHFTNMRSFVLNDESGLLMASWPKGRLKYPFPYFSEVMTGFEYCAAVGMLYEGLTDEALTCIEAIRSRHDGRKRSPFNEIECGHHYARAMASWGSVLALSGFHYSGVNKTMSFTSVPGTYFWSNGYAWGTCKITETEAVLDVLKGTIDIRQLKVGNRNIKLKGSLLTGKERRVVKLDKKQEK